MTVRKALTFYAGWNGAWADSKRLYEYTYTEVARESDDIWASNYTMSKTYPNLVVQFTPEESAIQARYLGDHVTLEQEWIPQFIMGMKTLPEFEDFRQYLFSFHFEEFMETYRAAYDRYNAL